MRMLLIAEARSNFNEECYRLSYGFNIRCISREFKMGFIMEFVENLVLKLMEDPKESDRKSSGSTCMQLRIGATRDLGDLELSSLALLVLDL